MLGGITISRSFKWDVFCMHKLVGVVTMWMVALGHWVEQLMKGLHGQVVVIAFTFWVQHWGIECVDAFHHRIGCIGARIGTSVWLMNKSNYVTQTGVYFMKSISLHYLYKFSSIFNSVCNFVSYVKYKWLFSKLNCLLIFSDYWVSLSLIILPVIWDI